jgi:cephalosporin hydroxylase
MRLPETSIDIEASAALFADKDGFTQYHQGRAMWKTKDDLDRYRILLAGDAIDLLIETGTRWGGFAAWVADTFGIDVITIDTSPAIHGSLPSRVTSIRGDSIDPAVIGQVREIVRGRRAMVVLDSDHHRQHVAAEITGYSSFVGKRCALVVEDTIADYAPSVGRRCGNRIPEVGGPALAVMDLLMDSPLFERDVIEDLTPLSHHPAGWWRRTS